MSTYDDNDRFRIRESYEFLLRAADAASPLGVGETELVTALSDPKLRRPLKRDWVLRDLAYLDGRGLIERRVESEPLTGRQHARWYLTARGKDFLVAGMPWAKVNEFAN